MNRSVLHSIVFLLSLTWASLGHAHKQSDSYLSVTQPAEGAILRVQWDIALRDLEHAVGLDVNTDASITWGEVQQRQSALVNYARSHLQVASAGNEARECPLQFQQLLIDEHVDGKYAVLRFDAMCAARTTQIELRYSLLFDLDPNHHGLVDVRSEGSSQAVILANDSRVLRVSLDAKQPSVQLTSFILDGIWHIWHGYDHVLFLLTLLLPAVVMQRAGRWEPRESLRDALIDIVKVVTAFTLAHSITLTLGALGWVYVPTRIVESAIALTVLLGALNILLPLVQRRRWLVALVFGLVHGLGFASVLADLGLSDWNLLFALLGFNAGVEIGQLAIVVVAVPLMYASRRTTAYRRVVLPVGAAVVACIALNWFATRAFA